MPGCFAVLGFCLFVCTYAMEACVLASQGRISSMNPVLQWKQQGCQQCTALG